MASYDGTNKSSAGCAQHLPYWEINTPYTRELYNEAMAEASPEAVKFCNPDGYNQQDKYIFRFYHYSSSLPGISTSLQRVRAQRATQSAAAKIFLAS